LEKYHQVYCESIPPPHLDGGLDRISWLPSSIGAFSVWSAYRLIRENSWNSMEETSWKFKEDIIHVLRNCPATKEVWDQVVPLSQYNSFFSSNLSERLLSNLQSCVVLDSVGVNWGSLFRIILWRIWKNRNIFVFQGYASTGGVVRNHIGEWIMSFNHFLGTCSVFDAEVRGILDGLTLLKEQRLERILIHTNNLEVAQALRMNTLAISISTLVRRIQKLLLQYKGHWVVKHIPREANCVADKIAKLVFADKAGVNVLTTAPIDLLDLIDKDKTNGAFDIVGPN
ncbi:hypothetical protein Golax_016804, partial [Gossypium laxum]|nr:hypothetical protein [Gossypium laxum]